LLSQLLSCCQVGSFAPVTVWCFCHKRTIWLTGCVEGQLPDNSSIVVVAVVVVDVVLLKAKEKKKSIGKKAERRSLLLPILILKQTDQNRPRLGSSSGQRLCRWPAPSNDEKPLLKRSSSTYIRSRNDHFPLGIDKRFWRFSSCQLCRSTISCSAR
ncbi:hypothetical protein T05_10248, partial [Trichinella murrelli]